MYEHLKGKIISFEGGEGSGKTTIINLLEKELTKSGLNVIKVREPGGCDISEKIRNIIVDKNNTNLCSRSEFLLFAASRAQLMEEKIKPLMKNNNVIIYDRFIDSSVVYQGIVRGLDINFIKEVNYFATSGFVPNITFYLDLDPEIGLQRINENNREKNRLDLESILFHQNVRNGYLYLCEKEKERIKKIDANQKPNEILKDILKELKK